MARIHRFLPDDFRWEGITVESYSNAAIRGVTKQVLIGPDDGAEKYTVRYFELAPGTRSSLDRHEHDHGVVILRGRGRLLLGEVAHDVGFGDAVYIGPNEVHQFENASAEPFGFLCIVTGRRP